MSADSPRIATPVVVPPQVVSDRSILDSAIGFISDVTLVAHQSHTEPKDTIIWARFETVADISDPCFGVDWELEGNVAPPLLLILGYGLGVQVWAIPANGEAIEVLSWRHGVVSTLRVLPTPASIRSTDEHGRADETIDAYVEKRPLIALVDSSTPTQPQFCTLNFISLKTGKQVKTIKFKNPILDVITNRTSVVVVFHERVAIFDARTLEDRLSITTCYPSPGINPNPVALGPRWLAYAEQKLLPSKRSGGGWDGEGIASYTATVLNAAKSFGKGLRELGEQVAAGLTGTTGGGNLSKNSSFDSNTGMEAKQAGIITIIDIEQTMKDYSPTSTTTNSGSIGNEPIVAHFIAHSEAIVAMEFDNSGMLLLTADRRGHDFHVFRIQPHPVSPSLSAVHHLYVLHRGDTSAKVQNITFSLDSRWVAISTLRGTTHVFPITPYGGPMGVRTHTSLHVVNKLSRFHRSAGLSADGRSNSPITHSESTTFMQSLQPYHNTTLPPFPRPTVVLPLAQLRQPFALGSPPVSAGLVMPGKMGANSSGPSNASQQRQRHTSLSDDNGKPLSVCAIFAKSRSWLLEPPNATREASHRIQRKAIDSLFVMAGHGALIQYDLDTKLAPNIAKEKISDDTPIELDVEAKAQWNLGRRRDGSQELMPPLGNDNWLIKDRNSSLLLESARQYDDMEEKTESWVSQVEIITHAGPHRRLWMGPQCVFKTYNTPSGSNLNHVDVEAVEIGVSKSSSAPSAMRSHPLSMPAAGARCNLPVLIESGSYSSVEQSPKLMDRFRHEHLDSDFTVSHGDSRLKEDLADAMRESPSVSEVHKSAGRLTSEVVSSDNISFYDARADPDIGDDDSDLNVMSSYSTTLATTTEQQPALTGWNLVCNVDSDKNRIPKIYPNTFNRQSDIQIRPKASVENVVNPLGTVTTVFSDFFSEVRRDILDEVVSQLSTEEDIIHENCDESLFRPVVTIFCDDKERQAAEKAADLENAEFRKPPETIKNKLVVPVIAKEVDAEMSKREKNMKSGKMKIRTLKSFGKEQNIDVEQRQTPDMKPNAKLPPQETKIVEATVKSDASFSDTNLSPNTLTNIEQKQIDKCEITKEIKTPENKTKSGECKKSNMKQPETGGKEEEEPMEFKRMTPIHVAKQRKQTLISTESKSLSKDQSGEDNECKMAIVKSTKSVEVKKSPKSSATKTMVKKNDSNDDEENKCTKDKSQHVNLKTTQQTITSDVCEKKSILPESNKFKEVLKEESLEIKENPTSHTELDEPVKTHCTKSTVSQKDTCKIGGKLDNASGHVSSSIHDKESKMLVGTTIDEMDNKSVKEQKISEEQGKSSKDIAKAFNTSEKTSSSNSKTATSKTDDKIEDKNKEDTNVYTIKVIESNVSKKQVDSVKPKNADSKNLQDIQNKQNKKGDSKSCAALAINVKKSSNREQRNDSKEYSNTQTVFRDKNDVIVDDDNVKTVSKNKNQKTKSNADKVDVQSSSQKDCTNVVADVNDTAKKSESSLEILVLNEESEIHQILESKTEISPITQISKQPCSVWESVRKVKSVQKDIETNDSYPSLGTVSKTKKNNNKNKDNIAENNNDNVTHDVCTTPKHTQKLDKQLNSKNETKTASKWATGFVEGFPTIQPLEPLPPLPALEPLDMTSFSTILKNNDIKTFTINNDDVSDKSLINFDSPLQESPKSDMHKNLIFALCGSLHYDDTDKMCMDVKSAKTKSALNSELEDETAGEYKLLNENDEQYLSFEQSSQEAVIATNITVTKDKFPSSSNSSASEEIIIIEEKKMSKKQRKKRQQQMESRKEKAESVTREVDEEELRPLIAMSDSHTEIATVNMSLSSGNANDREIQQSKPFLIARSSPLDNSTPPITTTDSESPMPVTTTSDDNLLYYNVLPSNTATNNAPIKLKTKRLEHKINLLAAIDAATSSSTSSAEESNVDIADNPRKTSSDHELPILGLNITSQVQSTSTNVTLITPSCTTKKKTKRRKR